MTKGVTQRHTDEEMHGDGHGEGHVPSIYSASAPVSPNVTCSPTQRLSEPRSYGCLWGSHHIGMLDYISGRGQVIPPPARLCFLEVRAGTSHQRVGTAALQPPSLGAPQNSLDSPNETHLYPPYNVGTSPVPGMGTPVHPLSRTA